VYPCIGVPRVEPRYRVTCSNWPFPEKLNGALSAAPPLMPSTFIAAAGTS
jgi:hypothetical protein